MKPLSSFLLFGVLLLILSQPGFGAILDVLAGSDFFVTMPGTSFMGVPLGGPQFLLHNPCRPRRHKLYGCMTINRNSNDCGTAASPEGTFSSSLNVFFLSSGWAP